VSSTIGPLLPSKGPNLPVTKEDYCCEFESEFESTQGYHMTGLATLTLGRLLALN